MPDGQAVESFPAGTPFGEMLVHQGLESDVVGGFQQVYEFVDHEALGGLFGEIGVEANAVG